MQLKGFRSFGLNAMAWVCNVPHRFVCLNTWPPAGGPALGSYGLSRWDLDGGSRSLGAGLEGSTCLWLGTSPLCFLIHGDVKTHAPAFLLTGLLYHTFPAILG